MGNHEDSSALIVHDVVEKLDDYCAMDEDTEGLIQSIAAYVVSGWWALSGGCMAEFERLMEEKREMAIASICSMTSMAHAIRSGMADEWIAETTGAGR